MPEASPGGTDPPYPPAVRLRGGRPGACLSGGGRVRKHTPLGVCLRWTKGSQPKAKFGGYAPAGTAPGGVPLGSGAPRTACCGDQADHWRQDLWRLLALAASFGASG